GRLGKGGDVGWNRALYRPRRDAHLVETVMRAVMGDASVRGPQLTHDFEALFKYFLIIFERDSEWLIFPTVIASTRREIDAPAGEQVECRPLLRHADRVVQR